MTHYYNANHTAKASALHRALLLVICFILSFTSISFAQTIGGNVFGGGNQGNVNQSSTVELRGGIIEGNVFGGGNEAEVENSTSVTISGGELKRNVYGAGNQGKVGSSSTVTLKGGTIMGDVYGGARAANVGGSTFVDVNATSTLLVSGVYGGNDVSGTIGTSTELPFNSPLATGIDKTWNSFVRIANNTHPIIIGSLYGGGNGAYTYADESKKPVLGKTYLEIQGGIFGNIYGGGNNATVTGNTVIYMNNQLLSLSVHSATLGNFKNLFDATDYSTNGENITFKQHVSRMFGGNNLAEMAIRPTWHLQGGSINNLYSGGNRGAMTNENGILLPLTSADLTVNNVYGGCRIADVDPGTNAPGEDKTIQDYTFPAGYATRVYITAGNINNVYGGNDISGKVHYGTNLAIFSNIKGDVYGGGNGSYAYTDNSAWVTAHPEDADYYYDPSTSSIDALFNFRPHIEKTLIHVAGSETKSITLGSVYCGGNSATLYQAEGDAAATFKIGKNVTIGNVFLGSNGANMLSSDMAAKYAREENSVKFSSISFGEYVVARYMDGVAVNIVPTIVWDNELDYSTRIGSFFCGGNVGSMTYGGVAKTENNNLLIFPAGITITDKIVAGCNKASIIQGGKVIYEGGLIGNADTNGDKVRIKVLSRLEPSLSDDPVYYQDADGTIKSSQIYQGANVYGGCYQSGVVNGNVVIDVESDIIAPDLNESYLTSTGDYIDASALAIYGGGYGENAVIEGNTTINLTEEARVLLVFGGGEMGEVTGNTTVKLAQGLKTKDGDNNYQNAYKVYAGGYAGPVGGNTTLNLLGGSVMSAFAGACNANIGGTTEAIIGAGTPGVPYVTHAVYGGNDFGGTIGGTNAISKLYNVEISDDIVKNVRTQTYVKYVSGKIGRAIYGGSYGSYAYNNQDIYGTLTNHTYPTINATVSKQDGDSDDIITTNTFVDIASQSTSEHDVIGSENSNETLTMIAGGGRGYKGLPQYVEVGQTYLLLHGKDYAYRNEKLMAHRVYGGGNLSKVNNTLIDAYSGSFGQIFGGTHGVKTEADGDLNATYDCANTTINYYGSMGKADMNLFGTGANSGATETATINLYAGNVGNVYGGSLSEGYTAETNVNVPNNSTIKANAIFGGALGESEDRPCDVGVSNITFSSATATVENIIKEVIKDGIKEVIYGGIYGGNHDYRATKETNVTINVPVKDKYENLIPIFGAGYGAATIAGSTHITLEADAKVANVYGGGRKGKVYNVYSNYSNGEAFSQYANNGKHASWQINDYNLNTSIKIHGGPRPASDGEQLFVDKAHVTGNVYGAGFGSDANTCGKTKVQLLGGTVDGDIYGGGFEGSMLSLDNSKDYDVNISSLCVIEGGQVRNVFGGGYQGNIEGNSGVDIGTKTGTIFYAGVPTILRSAYGGGEMAKVSGTSTVNMYNGYIGYRYDAKSTATNEEDKYIPELKLNADDEANLLKENGNLYGAGFGEGAVVMNTQVNLYDGTVRNGVYGGGEIAAVGDGTYNSATQKYTITKGGQTNVKMYGGLVVGDVFGGGRGFSYDLTGNQVIGKTLYSDGYVFGKTKVEIYRGTVGTDASLAEGHGNVFGGGNIGYVYSAGVKRTDETNGTKIKGHYYTNDDFTERTEDCCVRISVNCLVTADNGVTISNNKHFAKGESVPTEYLNTLADGDPIRSSLGNDGVVIADAGVTISNNKHFAKGEYVPTEYLNMLAAGDDEWDSLDDDGVTIRNAVFAGGNVSAGSDLVYANAVTVYGNATASVIDAFSRDLVMLGGEHIGGLYGDGNLTFVDGYRELNITNYGTDYHHLSKQINKSAYDALDYREQAYYTYDENEETENKWKIYDTSGRTMNTIQRADFCGVFGCRILLHGAQDRVPDVVDYTNYTINRVGEVSLNCVTQDSHNQSIATQSSDTPTDITHGNYFGIYNIVNFLGSLTSDVEFTGNYYYKHKEDNINNTNRNARTSVNTVALASGVFLELVESLDNKGEKVYGPVTGVIGLDLINVKPGEGGGFVYAKNEHGKAKVITDPNKKIHFTLSDANSGAITHAAYEYDETDKQKLQTSGNFVLIDSERSVIDDCFPNAGDINSPAHYWYINGNYYVYEQNISAYTGAARSYDKSLNIPLTITKGSNGKVRIKSIKPNKYFVGNSSVSSFRYGNTVYTLNDPISYWDWTQLTNDTQRGYFVDETYIAQPGSTTYAEGSVIGKDKYDGLSDDEKQYYRISNEMSHDNGYLLTFDMTNPLEWDTYYTKSTNSGDKLLGSALKDLDQNVQDTYLQAPTIKCNVGGIYGQRSYEMGDNVGQAVIDGHAEIVRDYSSLLVAGSLADFEEVYIAKEDVIIGQVTYVEGSSIGRTIFNGLDAQQQSAFDRAYLCINTIEVAEKDYVLNGNLISESRYNDLDRISQTNDEYLAGINVNQYFSLAWTCKKAGKYGGTYFNQGQNYNAIDICALPNAERTKKVKIEGKDVQVFTFNYDALDLFVANFDDDIRKYGSPYDQEVVYVDFTATFTGDDQTPLKKKTLDNGVYNGDVDDFTVTKNQKLSRREYELILNEQAHYVPVQLSSGINYIVEQQFEIGDDVYVSGQTMTQDAFNNLNETQKQNITTFNNKTSVTNAYFCKSDYKPSNISPSITAINTEVAKYKIGSIISKEDFDKLPNYQKEFNIVGDASIETATLYVPRESDIQNLSKDRIITVELEYKYNDNNREKTEKHVINIRVQFKSGQPSIGEVIAPAVVLPNTTVGLTVPSIIPGAYEIIGGGWEIFKNKADADSRKNGEPYINNATPMYWYQNGYYVAYYAKTYLGKAYSNPVPFTVANYHRLGEVMNHPEYMYIDHKEVKRNPKIYLDAAEYGNASIAANSTKNDLDYLVDLLSVTYQVNTEEVKNPETDKTTTITTNEVDERIKGCANLDFILRSDISPKAKANWSSIASGNGQCFAGTLHGNGYTISGLNNSLFGNLCGKVYNLGVTGSFTGGGIADNGTCPLSQHTSTNGYAENCWVYTTGTPNPTTTKAIIGAGGTIVNSYYHANNAFAEGEGIATKKDASAFLRGEVTYNLNGFHLYKRSNSQQKYYVENYFADGDFIYANGTIPLTSDERLKNGQYIPLADDYIFFGQRLIYGDGHESLPNRINKNGNSIDRTAANSDRVYSAPAYFMGSTPSQVYFNTESKFVGMYNSKPIHQNLTAIDFTGSDANDTDDAKSLLDFEKLTGFALGEELTKNMLVYANDEGANQSSYSIISNYLGETPFAESTYRKVEENKSPSRGHLVTKQGSYYIALTDHFLVDKENFNVPIAYQFASNKRMWYQREPDRFAVAGNGNGDGWDIICLPFTANLVTTHQKGEITHFYGESKKMHEYWLRELKEVSTTTSDGQTTTTATFASPSAIVGNSYTRDNDFLSDYYYSKYNDKNDDTYQDYYKNSETFAGYAYLQANTPYIIAFPGQSYHEFDMSGNFEPKNTATSISKLEKQEVTFISETGAEIGVTDKNVCKRTADGYNFIGTYQTNDINGYLINADGSAFVKPVAQGSQPIAQSSIPFRGYITKSSSNAPTTRQIFIGSAAEEDEVQDDVDNRGITVYGRRGGIYIESTLEDETVVTIYRLNGQLVQKVTVQPMGKVFVPVALRGIYIVNRQKVSVL